MGFSNRCFRSSERLVWYIKRQKSFFHYLFSRSIALEYRGLRGYRGLQGFTRGDRGLKGVTGGYGGLQRIIETFSN